MTSRKNTWSRLMQKQLHLLGLSLIFLCLHGCSADQQAFAEKRLRQWLVANEKGNIDLYLKCVSQRIASGIMPKNTPKKTYIRIKKEFAERSRKLFKAYVLKKIELSSRRNNLFIFTVNYFLNGQEHSDNITVVKEAGRWKVDEK